MTQTMPPALLAYIEQGEGLTVEFKKSTTDITKDVYDTVCSFSNRNGGHIFLGVKDNGKILGIQPDRIDQMMKDFTAAINNENKIYPPLYLTPIDYEIDGKRILYIHVPPSQSVCRCNGRIFDRLHEADIDITNHADDVYRLYARKHGSYFVNKVTHFGIDSLRHDLIERAKKMSRARDEHHLWLTMSDEELLRSAGLILTDEHTQQEGITIAGILLFGKDSTIMSVLPQHKTDAIFRVFNTDRYDDRDVITTNLIESYDRLLEFGRKHLNDTFYLEDIQSVSPRDKILREIISNLLAHRDYSSGYVAKMVIEKDQIITENANLAHGYGPLNLNTFSAYVKNPPISKVFREIGFADELGSGMINTNKYTRIYSGGEPQFIEGDTFRIIIPLSEVATATVGPTVRNTPSEEIEAEIKLTQTEQRILEEIKKNAHITRPELMASLGVAKSTLDRAISHLKKLTLLERIGPNKTGYWKVNC